MAGVADIVSGASSPISSLISGIFGSSNTNKTNKNNMKIAQMNNEWNSAEAAKNRDWMEQQRIAENEWNEKMWNMSNEYNSAAAVRERNEAAGLNPYFADSGVPAGQVSSASTGSSSAPVAESVRQMPFLPKVDLSSVSSAINSYFSNRESASRSQLNDLDFGLKSMYGDDYYRADIASKVNGQFEQLNPLYRAQRFNEAPNLLGIDIESKRQSVEGLRIHNQLELAQKSLAYVDAATGKILNSYLPAQQQADLWIKASQVFVNYQQGFLTKEKLRTEVLNQTRISLENAGKRLSNKIIEATADGVISAMNEENEYNSGYYKWLKRYAGSVAEFDKDQTFFNWKESLYKSSTAESNYYWRHADRFLRMLSGALGTGTGAAAGAYFGSQYRSAAPHARTK